MALYHSALWKKPNQTTMFKEEYFTALASQTVFFFSLEIFKLPTACLIQLCVCVCVCAGVCVWHCVCVGGGGHRATFADKVKRKTTERKQKRIIRIMTTSSILCIHYLNKKRFVSEIVILVYMYSVYLASMYMLILYSFCSHFLT